VSSCKVPHIFSILNPELESWNVGRLVLFGERNRGDIVVQNFGTETLIPLICLQSHHKVSSPYCAFGSEKSNISGNGHGQSNDFLDDNSNS